MRFSFCMISGAMQTFLLNGPTTNGADCPISVTECWSWGLTVNQYYGVLFCLVAILFVPICFLREPSAEKIPQHSVREFTLQLWDTLCSLPCFYLMIFVVGSGALTNFLNITNVFMQYYILELTNLQASVLRHPPTCSLARCMLR